MTPERAVILGLSIFSLFPHALAIRYDYHCSELDNAEYLIVPRAMEWKEAEKYCEQKCDSHLLSIHSKHNFNELMDCAETIFYVDTKWEIWLGLFNTPNNITFKWVDGSDWDYGNINLTPKGIYPWSSDQPDTTKHCLYGSYTLNNIFEKRKIFWHLDNCSNIHSSFACNHCKSKLNILSLPVIDLIGYILIILMQFIFFLIVIWVLRKIFINLFEFTAIYKIEFSDKHNWIIEPSSKNKIFALLCSLLFVIDSILWICIWIHYLFEINRSIVFANWYSIVIFSAAPAYALHFYYVNTTIEYYSNSLKIFGNGIKKRDKFNIKILYYCAPGIITSILRISYQQHYSTTVILIASILYLSFQTVYHIWHIVDFYKGFNNLCHYWKSKQWEEYEKYGENERVHELLLKTTRIDVILISCVVTSCIQLCLQILLWIYVTPSAALFVFISFCALCTETIYVLSVYFMYDFGYGDYLKVYGGCHKILYSFFQRKHQREVQNGAFNLNELTYVSNKEQLQIQENDEDSNDSILLPGPDEDLKDCEPDYSYRQLLSGSKLENVHIPSEK